MAHLDGCDTAQLSVRSQADRAAAGTKAELAELNKHKKVIQFKLKVGGAVEGSSRRRANLGAVCIYSTAMHSNFVLV